MASYVTYQRCLGRQVSLHARGLEGNRRLINARSGVVDLSIQGFPPERCQKVDVSSPLAWLNPPHIQVTTQQATKEVFVG